MIFVASSLWRLISAQFEAERDRWFLWFPVGLGAGILFYFSLPSEPPAIITLFLLLFILALTILWWIAYPYRFILGAMIAVLLGFTVSQWRTVSVNMPMLSAPIRPTVIEGYVERIEYLPQGQRLTLSHLSFKFYYRREKLPHKARVTLRGRLQLFTLQPGQRVRLRAALMPPRGPSLPDAYNFRRRAYFEGLGAVGYGVSKPTILPPPEILPWKMNLAFMIERIRNRVTEKLRASIPGQEGAIAAALITGDRSGITQTTRLYFVDSGLAHILAISGLHLSIIAGIVFACLRRTLSLVPSITLLFPVKKAAALIACWVTLAYLLLSGGAVPAVRAFLMTVLVMVAIIFDRQALSIRSVSLAATIILLIMPEVLLSPSFQLSFAAVTALIVFYEGGGLDWFQREGKMSLMRRFMQYSAGIVLTTILATCATAPFTVYNFNRLTLQGIAANMLAIPLTSLYIMPMAIVTLLMMLMGDFSYGYVALGKGVGLLVSIAKTIAQWPGAVILVSDGGSLSFLLFVLGGLWLGLWKHAWRWWGCGLMALGALAYGLHPLPDLYISPQGKVIGIRDNAGQLLVSERRAGRFVQETWQQSLGLVESRPLDIEALQEGSPLSCDKGKCLFTKNNQTITLMFSGRKLRGVYDVNGKPLLDLDDLEETQGCVSYLRRDRINLQCVEETQGQRPWR